MTTGALGAWLYDYQRVISRVLGGITVVVGLVFMGLPMLQRDVRVHRLPAVGLGAAPLLGLLFAIGWTPCLGPTIVTVQSLALNEGTVGRGVLLSVAYSLGLGLPFVLVRRQHVWVTRLGGAMLVLVGLLLLTGWWDVLVADLRGWSQGYGVDV
jgi:cytochrome c-type biogenesis protein